MSVGSCSPGPTAELGLACRTCSGQPTQYRPSSPCGTCCRWRRRPPHLFHAGRCPGSVLVRKYPAAHPPEPRSGNWAAMRLQDQLHGAGRRPALAPWSPSMKPRPTSARGRRHLPSPDLVTTSGCPAITSSPTTRPARWFVADHRRGPRPADESFVGFGPSRPARRRAPARPACRSAWPAGHQAFATRHTCAGASLAARQLGPGLVGPPGQLAPSHHLRASPTGRPGRRPVCSTSSPAPRPFRDRAMDSRVGHAPNSSLKPWRGPPPAAALGERTFAQPSLPPLGDGATGPGRLREVTVVPASSSLPCAPAVVVPVSSWKCRVSWTTLARRRRAPGAAAGSHTVFERISTDRSELTLLGPPRSWCPSLTRRAAAIGDVYVAAHRASSLLTSGDAQRGGHLRASSVTLKAAAHLGCARPGLPGTVLVPTLDQVVPRPGCSRQAEWSARGSVRWRPALRASDLPVSSFQVDPFDADAGTPRPSTSMSSPPPSVAHRLPLVTGPKIW